jgi:hypothetical protein
MWWKFMVGLKAGENEGNFGSVEDTVKSDI